MGLLGLLQVTGQLAAEQHGVLGAPTMCKGTRAVQTHVQGSTVFNL